jgi:hypothetical protein
MAATFFRSIFLSGSDLKSPNADIPPPSNTRADLLLSRKEERGHGRNDETSIYHASAVLHFFISTSLPSSLFFAIVIVPPGVPE